MPPRPGDDHARGELVFVSYSHADADWVQRFAVLLKPLLRNRRLRLWVDTTLRGGDEWRPEIEAAIARSTAALLLVSADLLASDFVVEDELPALVRHGVRLLPVLVGDCLWDEEPALAGVQWLHDPGRDGPLGRDAGDPSRRDERLVAMCRRLVAALPAVAAPEPAPRAEPVAASVPDTVAAVPAGPSAGALSRVPDDPPGYVVRGELTALIDGVTATDTGGAVGVTAEGTPLGLVGQGGIGKSVLAAALGRDGRIRHRFPDGVFWATVGERPDVLAVQLDLLARLGDGGAAPRTTHDATARLRDVLRERRVLLLVDDVWSDAAAYAFRVTGPRGRVVYTTRERQVVAAVGAREHPIGVLSAEAARAVAGAVLGADTGTLPAIADGAFWQVGRVALAVALLAAAVRGGRSWDDVADALRREVDVYGDHPYANTFKAMQIAVAGLPPDLAAALLGLAAFPPDTAVPVAAVARYWARTRGPDVDVSRDLDRLAAGGVLRRDGDEIGFHDLQHDYVLLHSPGLPTLHADLLDAYRALLPDGGHDGWWQLPPDEPYVWDHLVTHLVGAGERRTLAATVTDPAYLARRIGGRGLHAAEADLTAAAHVLPEHRVIIWWQRWLARHAAFLAGFGATSGGAVGPTMLAWLQADPTRPTEVNPERLTPLLTAPYLAVRWGLSSPEPALVRALTGHRSAVRAVDWSPDGTLVAGGSDDGEVRLWDPDTGRTVAVIGTGDLPVTTVAWSPDGRHLAITAGSRVHIGNAEDRAAGPPLAGLTAVRDVAWSPDGHRLAVIGGLGRLRLCNPFDTHRDQLVVDHHGGLAHAAWSADGATLATADQDGAVEVWDVATRRRTGAAWHVPPPVRALSWAPRSSTLAVVSAGRIHLWRPTDDTMVVLGEHPYVTSVAWSAPGDVLATAGRDVRVWDPVSGRSTELGSHTDLVSSIAWSPDGTRLATAGGDREVQIWDTAVGRAVTPAPRPPEWVHAAAVSDDGRQIATLGGGRRGLSQSVVQVWDVAIGGAAIATAPGTGSDIALAWAAGGRFVHIGGAEPRQWEHATGRTTQIDEWVGDRGPGFRSVFAWAPDGKRLAVTYASGIRVWNVDEPRATTIRYPGSITALSWSADGLRLAAFGLRSFGTFKALGEVVIWQIGDARTSARLPRADDGNAVLAWSPDSSRLAVAVPHAPLILWEPATDATTSLPGHVDAVTGVAWSPDGRHAVTTSETGAVVLHPVDGTFDTRLQLAGANCVAWAGSTIVVGQRTGPAILELRTPDESSPAVP